MSLNYLNAYICIGLLKIKIIRIEDCFKIYGNRQRVSKKMLIELTLLYGLCVQNLSRTCENYNYTKPIFVSNIIFFTFELK